MKSGSLFTEIMRIIGSDPDLPAFSPSAKGLLEVSTNPKCNLDTIAEVALLDPGLSSQFLKHANSALYLTGGRILKIEDALMRIGLEEARRLAAHIIVFNLVEKFQTSHSQIAWKQFWTHTLLTARINKVLANIYDQTSGKEYFTGLLHNMGKLFWNHYFPNEFTKVIQESSRTGKTFYEVELNLFDVNHAEIGWILAEKWGLEDEISMAIRFHHNPTHNVNHKFFLGSVTSLSNSLAKIASLASSVDWRTISEWKYLDNFKPKFTLEINLFEEQQEVAQILKNLEGTEVSA